MAAERMVVEKTGGGAGGLESLLGDMDLEKMDLGALMKDLDPATLQQLVMEGMKDPQVQEMVSWVHMYNHNVVTTLKPPYVLLTLSHLHMYNSQHYTKHHTC